MDLTDISLHYNRTTWEKQLTSFIILWKKLNQDYSFMKIDIPKIDLTKSPILIFLDEEFGQSILIVQCLHRCLSSLNRVVKGNKQPTEEDVVTANSLMCQQVCILRILKMIDFRKLISMKSSFLMVSHINNGIKKNKNKRSIYRPFLI